MKASTKFHWTIKQIKAVRVFDLIRVQRCLKYACNANIIGDETENVRTPERMCDYSNGSKNIKSPRLGGGRISFEFDLVLAERSAFKLEPNSNCKAGL